MKKGHFYILVCENGKKTVKRREGYIHETSRNKYGIDNRGDSRRPCWTFTDIDSGLSNGQTYRTRTAAGEACEQYENAIINNRTNEFYKESAAIIAEAYRAEQDAPKAKQPRPIKSRTYNNFRKVWEAIQKKGYPAEEAAEITRRIFDDYEQNPAGLPISGRIDLIGNRTTYYIMIHYTNCTKRAEIRTNPAEMYIDIPAAELDAQKREIRRNDPGAVFTDEIGKPYIFRTFTGWTVYDAITAERIIYAANDQEAETIARAAAAGRAYTCNIMETGTGDTTPEGSPAGDPAPTQERPTTDGKTEDGQMDTTTPDEPERAGETAKTDGETPRPDPVTDSETSGTDCTQDSRTASETAGRDCTQEGTTDGRKASPPQDAPQAPTSPPKAASRTHYRRNHKRPPRGREKPTTGRHTETGRTPERMFAENPHFSDSA